MDTKCVGMCIGSCETVDVIIPVASVCAKYANVAKEICCNLSKATVFHSPIATTTSSPITIYTSSITTFNLGNQPKFVQIFAKNNGE